MKYNKTLTSKLYNNIINGFLSKYILYYYFINTDDKHFTTYVNKTYGANSLTINAINHIRQIRFKNIRKSILLSPSLLFSFITTIFTLIVSAFILIRNIFIPIDSILLISSTCSAIFLLIIIWFSPIYFYRQISSLSKEDFTEFISSNHSAQDMAAFISFRLYLVSMDIKNLFIHDHNNISIFNIERMELSNMHKHINQHSINRAFSDECKKYYTQYFLVWSAKNNSTKLQSAITAISIEIERINYLLINLSKKIKIDHALLCENFFQFSPSLTIFYLNKLQNNVRDIDLISETFSKISWETLEKHDVLYERLVAIIKESQRFIERIIKISKYQAQILLNPDLISSIFDIYSNKSHTEAIKLYCKTLLKAVEYYKVLTVENIDDENIKKIMDMRLAFCFYKRRGYPSIDLHYHLGNIYLKHHNISNFKTNKSENFDPFLTCISLDPYIEHGHSKNILFNFKAAHSYKRLSNEILETLIYLKKLVEETRYKISNDFWKYKIKPMNANSHVKSELALGTYLYKYISENDRSEVIFVTYGYSKLIRELCKNVFTSVATTYLRKSNIVSKTNNAQINHNNNYRFKAFILFPEQEDYLDSRLIKYSIDDDFLSNNSQIPISINIAGDNFIDHLTEPNNLIILLTGCDGYDKRGNILKKGRYKARLKTLLSNINDNALINDRQIEILNICLCESYKLVSGTQTLKSQLGNSHYEIELYTDSDFDYTFTDQTDRPLLKSQIF